MTSMKVRKKNKCTLPRIGLPEPGSGIHRQVPSNWATHKTQSDSAKNGNVTPFCGLNSYKMKGWNHHWSQVWGLCLLASTWWWGHPHNTIGLSPKWQHGTNLWGHHFQNEEWGSGAMQVGQQVCNGQSCCQPCRQTRPLTENLCLKQWGSSRNLTMPTAVQTHTATQDQYYKISIFNLRSFYVLQIFCTWGSVFIIYIVHPSWKLKLHDVLKASHARYWLGIWSRHRRRKWIHSWPVVYKANALECLSLLKWLSHDTWTPHRVMVASEQKLIKLYPL